MELLLQTLRGHAEGCTPTEAEWDTTLALAEQEHVLAYAAASARQLYPALPQPTRHRLTKIDRSAAIAAFYWSSELRSILAEFAACAIPVIPLKGPHLAQRLYGATTLRACRDLDLLVGANDLADAEALLDASGFIPGHADDYHRAWQRRDTVIELHLDIGNPLTFNFATASALERAQPATFQDVPCMQFTPEDELLYLCLHAARHRYDRLSLLLDLRLAFKKLPQTSIRWNPRTEPDALEGILALGQFMIQRFDPAFVPALQPRISTPYLAHLCALADKLWLERMSQPAKALDWRAANAFFLQIEQPGLPRIRRRIRHLQILATRLIEADTAFAMRLGFHRRWQAWLLRPARLIAKAIGHQPRRL